MDYMDLDGFVWNDRDRDGLLWNYLDWVRMVCIAIVLYMRNGLVWFDKDWDCMTWIGMDWY